MTGRDHLVCGDPHAKPGHSNERFEALGNYAVEHKPPVIVFMGDFADMPSLSSYDRGKKSFEGQRFKADIEAAIDAQERFWGPIHSHNAERRRLHERQYKPRVILLGGNHDEGRINRATQDSPELDGLISIDLLKYEEFGFEYVPYGTPIGVDGIYYCHHFPAGNGKYPLSGINLGRKLVQKNHRSSTVGHTHILDIYTEADVTRGKIWGLSAGCFFEWNPDYAGESAKFWWRGIVHKRNVRDGDYDPQLISLDELKRQYL